MISHIVKLALGLVLAAGRALAIFLAWPVHDLK